jgi:hypothetical protein
MFLSVRQEIEALARVYQKLVVSNANPVTGQAAPTAVCEVGNRKQQLICSQGALIRLSNVATIYFQE